MKTMLLLIALIALLAGCGTRNVVGPPPPEKAPAVSNGETPNKAPYTDHRYDGEPYRGTDPDLGPTG